MKKLSVTNDIVIRPNRKRWALETNLPHINAYQNDNLSFTQKSAYSNKIKAALHQAHSWNRDQDSPQVNLDVIAYQYN